MDVVFLAPAYPGEMPLFTRGLAEAGARVIGVGDQPIGAVPETAKRALSDYVQIASWADEDAVVSHRARLRCAAATSISSRRCGSRRCWSRRGCARRSARRA